MRDRKVLWGLLALLLVILILLTIGRINSTASSSAIAITFCGYTNSPSTDLRFGLFAVSNHAAYAVRWRGDWVEIEGSHNHQGRITNPGLPGSTYDPVLKAGESLLLAVGEPNDASETVRWRYAMSFSPYTIRERWLEFSLRHNLPLGVGSFVFVDSQQILSPSNRITVTTEWLTK